MKKRLLDCTLRDGGYYNNWDFKIEMVQDLISSLDLAGVDIIELGFKSPIKGGKFRKCNDRFIWEVLEHKLPINSELAFMIDAKDFINGAEVDFSLIDDVIHDAKHSPFSICRLAIKHNEIEHALDIGRYVKDKGYTLFVNLMGITLLSEEQIKEFGAFTKIDPSALYFADTYGNLEPKDASKIIEQFSQFGLPIGVHTHDNLGLAFANCLASMEAGAEIIDGTLLVMGRGVGNVKTEQLVTYMQFKHNLYNGTSIQKFISKWMRPLQEFYKWGFTHNYMVSGLKHIHPLYTQALQASFLNSNRIEDVILGIEDSLKYDFTKIKDKLEPKVAIVIPARYKSTRFPGKPLALIDGKEMIIRVADIAASAIDKDSVYIATENEEIVKVVKSYGYRVILTSDSCLTGTDRVAEAALEIDADIIINIQGDEPMLDPNDIKRVIQAKLDYPDHIINCQAYLNANEDVTDKKIPKVITNINDELLYSSRNPIPGTKLGNGSRPKKQICIYGFDREHLKAFTSLNSKTPLEAEEDIEILRFIELGYKVKMVEVDGSTLAVDYPTDIIEVEKLLS